MNCKPEIILVKCSPAITGVLRASFSDDYELIECQTQEAAVAQASRQPPALVVVDVDDPDGPDGPAHLTAFKQLDRSLPVIVTSVQDAPPVVVQAMKLGAADFISLPFDPIDLAVRVASVLKQRRVGRNGAAADGGHGQPHGRLLLGQSPRMLDIRRIIDSVRDVDCTVLIRGESGTGKELVARELAGSEVRRGRPFVKVNCAALPSELLESELFGFERGAFTGATQRKLGKFEFAHRGTIFLDEIGELGCSMQAKLLQVLQDGEFSRLGGTGDTRVDVRIIAATNRDLEQAVAEGQFREDLFFRLNVIAIDLPPLRERSDEVPVLAEHFLRQYSVQYGRPYVTLSPETMRMFLDYEWPGNIRELENVIQRIVILGSELKARQEIAQALGHQGLAVPARPAPQTAAPAPGPGSAAAPAPPAAPRAAGTAGRSTPSLKAASRTAARLVERELILDILREMRWNRKAAAKRLGVSYKTLLAKIRANGLDGEQGPGGRAVPSSPAPADQPGMPSAQPH